MLCTEMTVETASIQAPRTLTGCEHSSAVLMTSRKSREAVAGERSYRVIKAATGPGEVIPHQKGRVKTWTTCQTKGDPFVFH